MGEKVTDFFCKWLVFATSPAKSPAKSLQTPFVSPTTTTTTTSATSPPVTAPLPVPHTSASKNKTTPMTPATPSSRSVFLSDWWLVSLKDNCGGNRVGVGGRTYNRLNMPREFTSSLIRKRIDSFNLETIDGFTIVIDGPVNEERTKLNGFPIEACSHFLMGFPFNFESYTIDYFSKEPITSDCANCSGANVPCCPSPIPQDGSPATKLDAFIKLAEYDILNLSRKRESENCETCIRNKVKIEVDDGSYRPTRESSVPRRSPRFTDKHNPS